MALVEKPPGRYESDNGQKAQKPVATYVRLVHPVTNKFIAEYDPNRHILRVFDRGNEALIDLAIQ